MRNKEKELAIPSLIFTISLFYLATMAYTVALQLYQVGIVDELSIIVGTVAAAGCLICMYLTIQLLKTRIFKETYFFVVFVFLFSAASHVILKFVLKIDFPPQWLITSSIVIGTPLACVFGGYSKRTVQMRLRKLGLTQGITLVTLFVLVSLPVIEVLPTIATWRLTSVGHIFGIAFESGNDAAKVQGQIVKSVFTAEVPIPSDAVFVAKQAVNITNQGSQKVDLKVYLEDLSGNLSKVKQLKIFFALRGGSEICPLSINNGNLKYEEVYLSIESHATVTMGVISLAQNVSSTDITVMSLSMRFADYKLGISMSIDSL